MNTNPYVVEKVPPEYMKGCPAGLELWYCHKEGYSYIPVWGSIGTKKEAEKVCREYNLSGKVRYAK